VRARSDSELVRVKSPVKSKRVKNCEVCEHHRKYTRNVRPTNSWGENADLQLVFASSAPVAAMISSDD
jgi:hypothetical protein